jgi:hypothetical protein
MNNFSNISALTSASLDFCVQNLQDEEISLDDIRQLCLGNYKYIHLLTFVLSHHVNSSVLISSRKYFVREN